MMCSIGYCRLAGGCPFCAGDFNDYDKDKVLFYTTGENRRYCRRVARSLVLEDLLPPMGSIGRMFVVGALLTCLTATTVAQSLPGPFQNSPRTAAASSAQFGARATEVIETNACGREDDYVKIRLEMAAGNFDSEGEDLAHILLAKMAFIRANNQQPRKISPNHDCRKEMFRPLLPEDTRTLDQLRQAEVDLLSSDPTHCARIDNVRLQPEQKDGTNVTSPPGVAMNITVSLQCLSLQVNEAILAMKKKSQLGSSKLPCLETLTTSSNGEFDATDRELMRMLYLNGLPEPGNGGILYPKTIDYMYKALLATRGHLSDATYSIILGCDDPAGDALGSPEDTADRYAWYKELARDLGDLFDWAIFTYLTHAVFPAGGILLAAPFLLSAATGDPNLLAHFDIRIPESENHRLNIETSKYLTNAAIIAHLKSEGYDRVEGLENDQAGVHDWLLQRLQNIASIDFQEYNARPYTRYSLNAILNLYDYAAILGDKKLRTAAQIVLDLSEAKFAATSNRGRRVVPYRRLSDAEGDDNAYLYETRKDADHEVARAMMLSGQTQLLDKTVSDPSIAIGALSEMVNAATSDYRLPASVLSAAIERRTFEQTVRHTAVERVEQSPAFTISAGGIQAESTGKIFGIGKVADRGLAMPTVIIPTIGGAYMRDLFRFAGDGIHDKRTENTCIAPGFACGINPKLSLLFAGCIESQGAISFVSSAVCIPNIDGPHFYIAVRIAECSDAFCRKGLQWGVMDIVEATPPRRCLTPKAPSGCDAAYTRFKTERAAALNRTNPNSRGEGVYTTARGLTITFSVADSPRVDLKPVVDIPVKEDHGPFILSINGAPPPPWITAGGVFDADGNGRAIIKGAGGPVIIDFSSAPKVTPQ